MNSEVIQLFAARSLNRLRSVTEDECGPRKRCNSATLEAECQHPGPHFISKFTEGQRMCIITPKKRSQTSYWCSWCKFALRADGFCLFIRPQTHLFDCFLNLTAFMF